MQKTSEHQVTLSPSAKVYPHSLNLALAAARELLPDAVEIRTNRRSATFRRQARVAQNAPLATSDNEEMGRAS